MTVRTLCELFRHGVLEDARPQAASLAPANGEPSNWISSQQVAERVENLFHFWRSIRLERRDRVLIWMPNRPEWALSDFSLLASGAVDVPLYLTLAGSDVRAILENCRPRFAVLGSSALRQRLLEAAGADLRPEAVITLDGGDTGSGVIAWPEALRTGERLRRQQGPTAFLERLSSTRPEDVATLIYTSGTTGTPKGVALTHANLLSNVLACLRVIRLGPEDVALSFLPLCHVYERMLDYCYWLRRARIVYAEDPRRAGNLLAFVRPTALGAVPRFYEKLLERILERRHRLRPAQKRFFDWALRVGREHNGLRETGRALPLELRLQHTLARWLVYRRIHRALGGRLRLLISGGAPLAKQVSETLWALGIPVLQGYGLTETSPVVTLNPPDGNRSGTVGPPIPGTDVRIAEDGEVFVRGPGVMKEYYRNPEATRQALTNGWFATGDVGQLDADGYLRITDRKKELLVTSGGKNVAPAPLEQLLESDPLIAQAMLIGSGRRFLSALLVPDFEMLERQARRRGIDWSERRQLIEHPFTRRLYKERLGQLLRGRAPYEQVRRFTLLEREWTPESGELTPTLKLRRRVIKEGYREQIELMYRKPAATAAREV
ncbi:MAG: long-chain fatty acid--CoA ligase [Acidobacteriota bacterium]